MLQRYRLFGLGDPFQIRVVAAPVVGMNKGRKAATHNPGLNAGQQFFCGGVGPLDDAFLA